MHLTWTNKVDNFKVSGLSSTIFICRALAISNHLLYYSSLSNPIFFSTYCCRLPLQISLRWFFFSMLLFIFSIVSQTRQCVQIIVYSAQYFILGKVLVLSHAFCIIYEIHHWAQIASFKKFRLYCVRKQSGIL